MKYKHNGRPIFTYTLPGGAIYPSPPSVKTLRV